MRAAPLIVLLAACGTEGGEDGGGARLPNRGIAGWERVAPSEDETFVLTPDVDGETWGDPSALVVGDEVVVYFTVTTAEGSTIHRTASPDGVTFGAPSVALADASDASVVAKPGGFWMAYADQVGLGLAESDDGLTFSRVTTTGIAPDLAEPSLVLDGDRLVLFAVTAEGSIVRAEAGSDLTFGPAVDALVPVADCPDAFGEIEPCWDGTALGGPDVRIATTATGRRVWRMWLTGRTGVRSDLGFAASEEGLAWTRYAFNPVVAESPAELAPSSVVFGDDYLLYWGEASVDSSGIALGRISPNATRSNPTESW